jgi:single-strand DNA-binding protein
MLIDLFTIGNEPELRHTQGGKAVVSLSLAMNIGYGDNKRTTWIDAALWEKRAEALIPYLSKGKQINGVLDDVELVPYKKGDGSAGAKIKARIVDIKLVRDGSQGQQAQPRQQTPAAAPAQPSGGMDNFDDDIPF